MKVYLLNVLYGKPERVELDTKDTLAVVFTLDNGKEIYVEAGSDFGDSLKVRSSGQIVIKPEVANVIEVTTKNFGEV